MDMLPDIFIGLAGRVDFVHRKNDNEFSSSCPNCGGQPHQDGTLPDRFCMWIVSRYGTPFGMCRKCGYKWTPLKEDAHWTHKEREEFKRKLAQLEKEFYARKAAELTVLSRKIQEQKLYEEYYNNAVESKRVMDSFNSMGIPADWVSYLRLGYITDYTVRGQFSTYKDNGFTFPIWSLNRIENIKIRVQNPINSGDRYRNVYKSGCQHLYTPLHDSEKLGNKIIILEGEKKAIVTHIKGGLNDNEYQIVGVQSALPEKRVINMLSDAEVVYLAMDPDTYVPAGNGQIPVLNLAKQIGIDRCRLVVPPKDTKFDDAINLGFRFVNAVNMAIKPDKL